MMTRGFAICAGLLVTAVYLNTTPVSALTMKECSEKYKAAKAAGNTAKWNDFRKAECGADATAAPAAAPNAAPAAEPTADAKPKKSRKKAASPETPAAEPAAPPAAAPAAPAAEEKPAKKAKKAAKSETPAAPVDAGNAVLPSAVSDKYKTQTPHFQRLHTCSDQWKANKANNGNGGLKWPQFYHACNDRLKGA